MRNLNLLLLMIMMMTTSFAQNSKDNMIQLVEPQRNGGMPLMQALNERVTLREFSDKMLTDQQLSDLLWAANGINRDNGKRTAPSARNCQEIDIYVLMSTGTYLYLADKHALQLVDAADIRSQAAMQPFVAKAPVLLMFVANYDKMTGMDKDAKEFYGATDAGFVSQNVYLYCASEKLATVVLGSIHRDFLEKKLGFKGKAILGQPVGYSK